MSEFIEIGDIVRRRSNIEAALELKSGSMIVLTNGATVRLSEPYESVRDKLLGVTSKSDQFDVEEFLKWCDSEDRDGETCGSGLSPLEDVRISRGIPAKELRDAIGYLIQAYMIDTGKMKCD